METKDVIKLRRADKVIRDYFSKEEFKHTHIKNPIWKQICGKYLNIKMKILKKIRFQFLHITNKVILRYRSWRALKMGIHNKK